MGLAAFVTGLPASTLFASRSRTSAARLLVALHPLVEQRVDDAAQGGDVAPPLRDEDPRRAFLDAADQAGAGLVGGDPFQQELGAELADRGRASGWAKASWTSLVSTQPK